MAEDRHIYGDVSSKTDMKRVFGEIRRDVTEAKSREALTELHRRAGYMITLTYAPSAGLLSATRRDSICSRRGIGQPCHAALCPGRRGTGTRSQRALLPGGQRPAAALSAGAATHPVELA